MKHDEILGTTEAGALMGRASTTIARWCRLGWIKATRLGGWAWQIPRSSLIGYVPPKRGGEPKDTVDTMA